MAQTIQVKRNLTSANAPTTLADGELAYVKNGHKLYVGADATVHNLISVDRQLEIHANSPAQVITGGTKTIDIARLKIPGGAAANLLQTDGLGNLTWATPAAVAPPLTPATNPEMEAGVRNDVMATPLNMLALTGATVATLTTQAKTLVLAINELKLATDALALGAQFVGSYDAAAGTILWTAGTGTGNTLPPADANNNGWYIIANVYGAVPPGGAPVGDYDIGDWLISDGSTGWTHLAFGGLSAVTASSVPVNPAIAGATDVQAVLTILDAENVQQDTALQGKVAKNGDQMSGSLLLPDLSPGHNPSAAANKKYVDAVSASNKDYIDNIASTAKVSVVGPALTGDGRTATPITLVAIDGGVYA
jgi:hypothetical protein